MRRVLVVSFFYPPDPAVGGRRVAKFVEYLPQCGWEPTVLTARTVEPASRPPSAGRVHATRFFSLWKLLPRQRAAAVPTPSLHERAARGGPIRRHTYGALRHLLPMSSVRMPDATLGWVPYAATEGQRLLEAGGFDAILSSAGPPSSHFVAARLQRASGLPWIADYRDLWSDNHWDARVAPFRWAERQLERRVLRRATLLTTVGPAWARRLADLHGKPVQVVFNGFDPRDYPAQVQPAAGFSITYVGSLYWPDQNPEPLFAALASLKERSGIDPGALGFELRFLGTEPGPIPSLAEKHGVNSWVRFVPGVPHAESLARQAASTALLFLGWRDPAEGFISAKIFEYLGAGRPILAVGPPGGAISEILEECKIAYLTEDPGEIATRLEGWLREFERAGALPARQDAAAVARYTRQAQTERLAGLLERAVRAGSGAV